MQRYEPKGYTPADRFSAADLNRIEETLQELTTPAEPFVVDLEKVTVDELAQALLQAGIIRDINAEEE